MASEQHQGKPRVFVIGLSRTGTSSLCAALQRLEYLPSHNPEPEPFFRGDFSVFNRFNAGADISVAGFYRELDEAFPGSKFILTVRDAESWLESVTTHFANLPKQSATPSRSALRARVYGAVWPTREQFIASYKRHIMQVCAHFEGRERSLLVMDLTSGEGWEKLCGLLGLEIPGHAFPHENSTESRGKRRVSRSLEVNPTESGVSLRFT